MGARAKGRPLWPKEHGAYGQLLLPLAAALAMGRPTPASGLLVLASLALFLAHEPLLVALGLRGRRAARDHGARARIVGLAFATLAASAGTLGLGLAGAWLAAVPPLLLVVALAPFVIRGREKTTAGEVVAAAALAAASLPVAVAGGIALPTALATWVTWAAAFAVSTAAVRWVIARHKTGAGPRSGLAVAAVATLATALLWLHGTVALAALPMVLAGWALIARPPHPRHLRRVGWTLVATSSLTAILVVTIVRLEAAAQAPPPCCAH